MRISGRRLLAAVTLGVTSSAIPAAAGLFHHPSTVPELKAKIGKQRNPVKKAELQIQLAHLILQQAAQAYDQNNFKAGQDLLYRYLSEAKISWETLKSSGRNAMRQPEGFKQLDMDFTADDRLLGDLRRQIPYPQSKVIKKIQLRSRNIHAQVLDAIFPGLHLRSRGRPAASSPHSAGNRLGVGQ
jgi:hypothetical protein